MKSILVAGRIATEGISMIVFVFCKAPSITTTTTTHHSMNAPSPKPLYHGHRSPKRRRCHDDTEEEDDNNPHHRRVVLLLDMDCFYAQCETVRLGLPRNLPLALMQWNSALAVNYPARDFGIKRGDSFEEVRSKSKGACVAIHLRVTPLDEEQATTSPTTVKSSPGEEEDAAAPGHAVIDPSDWSAYDDEFNQSAEIRERMYRNEKNRMISRTVGKACLDRYRLASSRIFSLIDDTLVTKIGRKNYILERASIDELFIDITAFCYMSRGEGVVSEKRSDADDDNANDVVMNFLSDCDSADRSGNCTFSKSGIQSSKETVICHETFVDVDESNGTIGKALRRGCHVAKTVRQILYDSLGFTLSAGISTNKLVAKLAATYGKPNGQALVYPSAMCKVMDETQISKARMLGGKLGKRVMSLLPDTETTMGSIVRLLSLDQLETTIGVESGRWVFDACRGIDHEPVKATLKVLPKSITAFKSFPNVSYPELEKWTALLARDIMKRVEMDNARNHRLPKSVSVGYTMVPGGAWIGRTFRLPFPNDKDFDLRVQKLVDGTRKVLLEKGHSSFIRIGFSAIDFVVRSKIGIDSFFSKGGDKASNTLPTKKSIVERVCDDRQKESSDKVESVTVKTRCNSTIIDEVKNHNHICKKIGKVNKDEALALALQSTYDREDALLAHMERYSTKRSSDEKGKKTPQKKGRVNQRNKIDFFLKK